MAGCETDPLSFLTQVLQDVGFPIRPVTTPTPFQPLWFSTGAGSAGVKAGGTLAVFKTRSWRPLIFLGFAHICSRGLRGWSQDGVTDRLLLWWGRGCAGGQPQGGGWVGEMERWWLGYKGLNPLRINLSCRLLRPLRLGWSQVCLAEIWRTQVCSRASSGGSSGSPLIDDDFLSPTLLLFSEKGTGRKWWTWVFFFYYYYCTEWFMCRVSLKGQDVMILWNGSPRSLYKSSWLRFKTCFILSAVYSHRINFQRNYLQLLSYLIWWKKEIIKCFQSTLCYWMKRKDQQYIS